MAKSSIDDFMYTVSEIGNMESILKDAKNPAGTTGISYSSWLRDNIQEAFIMTLQRRHLTTTQTTKLFSAFGNS